MWKENPKYVPTFNSGVHLQRHFQYARTERMKYKFKYAEMGDGDTIELTAGTIAVASGRISVTDAGTGVTKTKITMGFLVPVED